MLCLLIVVNGNCCLGFWLLRFLFYCWWIYFGLCNFSVSFISISLSAFSLELKRIVSNLNSTFVSNLNSTFEISDFFCSDLSRNLCL
uniref:Uncharacterized protein n=1 Tax=Rhizophora mucronata TaxID=61149 RepID=A0A2P2JIR0_RHIMU